MGRGGRGGGGGGSRGGSRGGGGSSSRSFSGGRGGSYSGRGGRSGGSSFSRPSRPSSSSSYGRSGYSGGYSSSRSSYNRPSYSRPSHNTVIINNSGNSGTSYSGSSTSRPSYTNTYGYKKVEQPPQAFPMWYVVSSIIAVLMAIVMVVSAFSARSDYMKYSNNRQKLAAGAVVDDYFRIEDETSDGWIDKEFVVREGMKYFYDKTGVVPYLIITEDIDGNYDFSDRDVEEFMRERYDLNIEDEGHMILLFAEPYSEEYYRYCYVGSAASQVVDEDAQDIINRKVDEYYYSDLHEDDYFATVFEESADLIMYNKEMGGFGVSLVIAAVLMGYVVVGGVILYRKHLRLLEQKNTKDILNKFSGEDGFTSLDYEADEELRRKYSQD